MSKYIACPECNALTHIHSATIEGNRIRRRRICQACDYVIYTQEMLESEYENLCEIKSAVKKANILTGD